MEIRSGIGRSAVRSSRVKFPGFVVGESCLENATRWSAASPRACTVGPHSGSPERGLAHTVKATVEESMAHCALTRRIAQANNPSTAAVDRSNLERLSVAWFPRWTRYDVLLMMHNTWRRQHPEFCCLISYPTVHLRILLVARLICHR